MAEGLREFGSRDKKEPNRSKHLCLAIDELLYLGLGYVRCTWKMQVVESTLTANPHEWASKGKLGNEEIVIIPVHNGKMLVSAPQRGDQVGELSRTHPEPL